MEALASGMGLTVGDRTLNSTRMASCDYFYFRAGPRSLQWKPGTTPILLVQQTISWPLIISSYGGEQSQEEVI